MTGGSNTLMHLGHDTAVRQHYKRATVPMVTSSHYNGTTEKMLTVTFDLSLNKKTSCIETGQFDLNMNYI